ncbi:hypothetical protein SAMN05421781_2435 [Marinococcus luteus]|uniref:Uncharacterized protein n=1 Tax=Marinococcus luteus TaxID=1122204 RepID=A0A1H2WIA0_9BACI|nr:hypothetical protein [Marinococcus luteus]SDW79984.1 hypothetical protein SAMN05421781_2435 [Marinococcus luteus]
MKPKTMMNLATLINGIGVFLFILASVPNWIPAILCLFGCTLLVFRKQAADWWNKNITKEPEQ